MGINIQIYRSTIGLFNCCIKTSKRIVFPKFRFNASNNHCFMYKLHEWSNHLVHLQKNKNLINSRYLCKGFIGINLFIHILLILCHDIHPNPGPPFDYTNLSLCHANIRSLRAKDKLLGIETELARKYDLIALSETWLTCNDKSEDFLLNGYQAPFRRDRSIGREGYGGVLLWVSDKLACKRRQDLEIYDIEAMWVEVRTINKKFFVCVIYRTDSNTDLTFWDKLQENIDAIRAQYNPKILICGDLNADLNTRHGRLLLEFCDNNALTIHVNEPTRITDTTSTILDQFLSNFPSHLKNVEILPPLPHCDHCVIAINCTFKVVKPKPYKRLMWNFKQADFALYRTKIEESNWDKCFERGNVDNVCDAICENILSIAKTVIPNRVVMIRPHDKPWYTNHLRQLNRRKLRLFRLAKRSKSIDDWLRFKMVRTQYQAEILTAKQADTTRKYAELAKNSNINPKKWWSLL